MDLKTEIINHIAVVGVPGENLDAGNALAFKEAMAPLMESSNKVLLDLSEVGFIDSSGLGAILSTLKKVHGLGGSLKLCCVSEPVQSLFELVRVNRVFSVYETREKALQAF